MRESVLAASDFSLDRPVVHVCGMNFQNFFRRIEFLHQRTLIRILYEFFEIQIVIFQLLWIMISGNFTVKPEKYVN